MVYHDGVMRNIILCCDLDRTVLPNGLQPESMGSRQIFTQVIRQCPIILVYVSGRDLMLLQQAICDYDIPVPHYAIGDVGTTLYHIEQQQWRHDQGWDAELEKDWPGTTRLQLQQFLRKYTPLIQQEEYKQGPYKLSYYIPPEQLTRDFIRQLEKALKATGLNTTVISSVDETAHIGLVDILPANASKFHAIEFLIKYLGADLQHAVFAGDSGNDLPVITSEVRSVLVNNAHADVKAHAHELLAEHGHASACYFACGDWLGLNGNYSAGVLEGLVHYHPELLPIVQQIIAQVHCKA